MKIGHQKKELKAIPNGEAKQAKRSHATQKAF
jgi:hypothetical protein